MCLVIPGPRVKAAGESPTAEKDTHRPGLAPASGLRAGGIGFFIVPRAMLKQETRTMSLQRWPWRQRGLSGFREQARRPAPPRRRPPIRPTLEALEDRYVLS